MKLQAHVALEVGSSVGLWALVIVMVAAVAAGIAGTVTLWLCLRQARPGDGCEVAFHVRAGHGLDQAQQGGIERPGGTLGDRP